MTVWNVLIVNSVMYDLNIVSKLRSLSLFCYDFGKAYSPIEAQRIQCRPTANWNYFTDTILIKLWSWFFLTRLLSEMWQLSYPSKLRSMYLQSFTKTAGTSFNFIGTENGSFAFSLSIDFQIVHLATIFTH